MPSTIDASPAAGADWIARLATPRAGALLEGHQPATSTVTQVLVTERGVFLAGSGPLPTGPLARQSWQPTAAPDIYLQKTGHDRALRLPCRSGQTPPDSVLLVSHENRRDLVLELPPLREWPNTAATLTWDIPREESRPCTQRRTPRLLPAPRGRDGAGFYGHCDDAALWNVVLEPRLGVDLDELRILATRDTVFLWAPRGLPPEIPRQEPGLRNLGDARRPLLVPEHRIPSPAWPAEEYLAGADCALGEGLVWWDDGESECLLRFRVSTLARASEWSGPAEVEET